MLRNESNFFVTIGSMSRFFTTFEPPELSAEAEMRWNQSLQAEEAVFSRRSWSDAVLGSDYDPDRDDADIATFEELVGDGSFIETITVQPTDSRGAAYGGARGYLGHVSKVTTPSADAHSSTTATWSVTFKIVGKV